MSLFCNWFIQVIWHRLYSTKSAAEKGTMYQLCNILDRTAVPSDPERTWRLLRTSCSSFCICCCWCPSTATLLFDCKPITCLLSKIYCQLLPNTETVTDEDVDGVNLYARELLTLALLWHEFHDPWKGGDGDRILLCWKMMLPIFKQQTIKIMRKQLIWLCRASICQSEKLPNYCGQGALIQEALLDGIFHAIYTWSTLIANWKPFWGPWELTSHHLQLWKLAEHLPLCTKYVK